MTLKLARMIGERLEISEAGTQTNERVPVATRRLLDEAWSGFRPEIGGRSIQIVVPDDSPEVHAHLAA